MRRAMVVLANGAPWEAAALSLVERDSSLVLLKRCVDVDDMLAALTAGQADVVLAGLDTPGLDTDAVAQMTRAGVVAVGVVPDGSDVALARATRIGVRITIEESQLHGPPAGLLTLLADEPPHRRAAVDEPVGPDTTNHGRILTVTGPHGSTGRSTVVLGIAHLLAQRGIHVTVVDADLMAPSLAQHLGVVDEVSGLLAAARLVTAGTLETEWSSAVREVAERTDLISGVPRPERWRDLAPGALSAIALQASRMGWVVIDAGAVSEADEGRVGTEAAQVADEVLVVGTADPVGLARMGRMLGRWSDVGAHPGADVRIVVNLQRRSLRAGDAEIAAVLRAAELSGPLHLLPYDRARADAASLAQRPVTEPARGSALSAAIGRLVSEMAPPETSRGGAKRRRASRGRRR